LLRLHWGGVTVQAASSCSKPGSELLAPDASPYYWSVGDGSDDVRAHIHTDGTLHIYGSGEMKHYTSLADENKYPHNDTIKKVVIGDGVTSIGNSAFSGCTALKSVIIPNGVKKIWSSAFYKCSKLTSVNLPDDLEYIGAYAFQESGLKSITIPKNVTNIGGSAFKDCSKLKKVIIKNSDSFYADITKFDRMVFDGTTDIKTLVIEEASSGKEAAVKKIIQTAFCWNGSTLGETSGITGENITIYLPSNMTTYFETNNVTFGSAAVSDVSSYDGSSDSSDDSDDDSDSDHASDSNQDSDDDDEDETASYRQEHRPAPPPTSRVEADALLNQLNYEISRVTDETTSINVVSKYYNSFSTEFMTKLQNEKMDGKMLYLEYDYEGSHYVTAIPGGPSLAVDHDWYGPVKLMTLFPTIPTGPAK